MKLPLRSEVCVGGYSIYDADGNAVIHCLSKYDFYHPRKSRKQVIAYHRKSAAQKIRDYVKFQ